MKPTTPTKQPTQSALQNLLLQYEKDIDLNEETLDVLSLSIPKKLSKYQIYFYYILEELASANERLDSLYHDSFMDWKYNQGKYASIKFSATEINKILKTDTIYLSQATKVVRLENELKMIEEMMNTVRNLGFSLNNRIMLRRIECGLI